MRSSVLLVAVLSMAAWSCGPGGSSGTGGGTAAGGMGGGASSAGGAAAGGTVTGGGSTGGGASGGGTSAAGGSVAGGSSGGGSAGGGSAAGGSAGGGTSAGGAGGSTSGGSAGGGSAIPFVFVIAMENQDGAGLLGVYGSSSAPYINNTLRRQYAYATNYQDVFNLLVPSEPHYLWLEGGTNVYADATFSTDDDPSPANSTTDVQHLATKLAAAGKTWRSYQEGLDPSTTGACPVTSSGFYAAKHDPFVFFQDVAGNPPSQTNASCASHHRAYTHQSFAADLAAGDVAQYTFITPDLCNLMHGATGCSNGCTSGLTISACISGGDTWLAAAVPPIVTFLQSHGGVLFIVWDEPALSTTTPFIAIGPHVKHGYGSSVMVSHSSFVKSVERIFGLPINSRVQSANDFADYFEPGFFP